MATPTLKKLSARQIRPIQPPSPKAEVAKVVPRTEPVRPLALAARDEPLPVPRTEPVALFRESGLPLEALPFRCVHSRSQPAMNHCPSTLSSARPLARPSATRSHYLLYHLGTMIKCMLGNTDETNDYRVAYTALQHSACTRRTAWSCATSRSYSTRTGTQSSPGSIHPYEFDRVQCRAGTVRARADQLLSGLPGLHAEARVLGVGYDRLRPADTVSSRPRLSLALPRTALARPPAHDSAAWTSRCGAAVATVLLSAISTAISVTFATENRFLRSQATITGSPFP
ncbi:hypothetical protein Ctob_009670 [Chrysochromulina tobinii]|uniref:Uncharacterized protein n=1 Tax=Chrysochromulina tobinii TaxID=1460289 RepID=A0A0M0JCH8_9EUKA|nr:hypothetical protein Ctob_009670 [Chrysochromulina tobinii]|eukprot:KOO24057.1 hypothetical protein Ctob_009670 [Chrysochromulina sp. CCMP291]